MSYRLNRRTLPCYAALGLAAQACVSAPQEQTLSGAPVKSGVITITSTTSAPSSTEVLGELVKAAPIDDPCTIVTMGSCSATSCDTAPVPELASAGAALSISSSTASFDASFAGGTYAGAAALSAWSNAGESISVTAPGAEVPKFVLTAVSPPALVLTSPDIASLTSPAIADRPHVSTANDFALAWTAEPASASYALVSLRWSSAGSYPQVHVDCAFPIADGQGVVPKELLAKLPAGQIGSMSITPGFKQTSSVGGGWSITLEAISPSFGPGNIQVPSSVDFDIE